jgi:Protein of unknown function (DUF2891)
VLSLSACSKPVYWELAMAADLSRFALLALDCVHRQYPNKIAHHLNGDADAKPPRELTPAFYGCYDWHSCVHGHWLLARMVRTQPNAPYVAQARAALNRSLTPENIAGEVRYQKAEGRISFERPYGLGWLLQLAAEFREWKDDHARRWSGALAPLEQLAVERLGAWLPKLACPVRSGEHSQTAFAMGLMLDWCRVAATPAFEGLLRSRVQSFFLNDRDAPLAYEPSGEDFLSPALAEADVVRRILKPPDFAAWLRRFLPGIPTGGSGAWLKPGVVTDPTDGKLVHLDGLNLSRAWMLEGIAQGLPAKDSRVPSLRAAAAVHRQAGLAAITGAHYEGGHWLGTFAVYLVTERGLR